MDFATLPPEINSGRMYCGPGAESMRDAAAGWDNLATRLSEVAADYRAVTSQLAESHGPACTVMASTAIPYIGWLSAIATLAAQTAIHANAAASAYDSALAATVPPRLIEANRELQRFLAATNCLGQTSQAIADAEADYERMWAADAEAMYAYAHASVDVCMLTPFGPPPGNDGRVPTKSPWALIAAPEVVSTGHQVMSAIPEALDTLSSPLSASLLPEIMTEAGVPDGVFNMVHGIGEVAGDQRCEGLRAVVVLVGLLECLAQVVAPEQPGGVEEGDGLDDLVLMTAVHVQATPDAVEHLAREYPQQRLAVLGTARYDSAPQNSAVGGRQDAHDGWSQCSPSARLSKLLNLLKPDAIEWPPPFVRPHPYRPSLNKRPRRC